MDTNSRPESAEADLDLERAAYAAQDAGSPAGFLAVQLYSTAKWREQKAQEHPEDDRNLPAARHLAALARQLLALPWDDAACQRLTAAWVHAPLVDTENLIIRSIGFSLGYPDLAELLDRLSGEYESAGKVRENRLRNTAERRGLRLEKSRRRDPRALGYGTYQLVDASINGIVAQGSDTGGRGYGLDLDDVEKYLNR